MPTLQEGERIMKQCRILTLTSIAISLILAATFAFADQQAKTFQLMAVKESPGASGTAVIGDKEIFLIIFMAQTGFVPN
jgi:hypothetical protein